MRLTDLINKKVAMWGYGVEAKATLSYLNKRLPELLITVICPENEGDDSQHFNHQTVDESLLSTFDVVIKSPGISPYQAAVEQATCQFTSPTALWFNNESDSVGAQVIAITGTKGKSTSSAMLAHVLKEAGHQVRLAGNFGDPLISVTQACDFIVLETSSYQAQDGAIQADVALLLNLFEEHLDWHGSVTQYHKDKWRLLACAKSVVLNRKDKQTGLCLSSHPLSQPVNCFEDEQGFYVLKNALMYQDKAVMSQHGWSLKGVHNLSNAAAVCTVALQLGLPIRTVMNALKSFQPLPHRLQSLGTFSGITVINDSISSTPLSSWAALATVDVKKTVLLLGGFDRGLDWGEFASQVVDQSPKAILCSGGNGGTIAAVLRSKGTDCHQFESLEEAVKRACSLAQAGDTILLSPGAPSFDAFANYQQRGVQFESWIKTLL